MAKKSTTSATSNDVSTTDTIAELTVESTESAPQEEVSEAPVKQYAMDLDLKFTEKSTGEIKYVTNVKYSLPEDKISATGTKRAEYKIFIDGIFFARATKYFRPMIYLKTKAQKEFQFKDGAELKQFVVKRASEFGAVKADVMESEYKDLIQTYGLTEDDIKNPAEKSQQAPAKLQQQTMFV